MSRVQYFGLHSSQHQLKAAASLQEVSRGRRENDPTNTRDNEASSFRSGHASQPLDDD
jgi:hypothetical protein